MRFHGPHIADLSLFSKIQSLIEIRWSTDVCKLLTRSLARSNLRETLIEKPSFNPSKMYSLNNGQPRDTLLQKGISNEYRGG